nr:MAG TPA: hypothetical protein [Caudoviricetes sp.]
MILYGVNLKVGSRVLNTGSFLEFFLWGIFEDRRDEGGGADFVRPPTIILRLRCDQCS